MAIMNKLWTDPSFLDLIQNKLTESEDLSAAYSESPESPMLQIGKNEAGPVQQVSRRGRKPTDRVVGQEIVIVNPNPPPKRKTDMPYKGVPLDLIKNSVEKEKFRRNAVNVKKGIQTIDAMANRLSSEYEKHTAVETGLEMAKAKASDVQAVLDRDLKSGAIKKLSKAVGDSFGASLHSYEQATTKIAAGASALKEQAYRIAGAQAMVTQAESLLETYNQEKAKDSEGKKLAELKQKMEDLKGGVNFAIDAIKDPKGAAKDVAAKIGLKIREALVDSIVDGLLGGEKLKQEMAQIESRIAAVNQRLEALKLTGLNAGVNQAWNGVQAEMQKTQTVQLELEMAKREQGDAVDRLATMERNHPNTTTVFSQLQQYYGDVQQAGFDALQSSKHYKSVMDEAEATVSSETAKVRQALEADRVMMNRLFPVDSGANLQDLDLQNERNDIAGYTASIDAWYKAENVDKQLATQRRLQDELRRNTQFEYIGTLVNSVQKDLGARQDDKLITR